MSQELPSANEALKTYLTRIGFSGEPTPSFPTLALINRLHLEAFPYENFDVQLARRVSRDPRAAFRKIVQQGRGGWCYEFNGLFAWMLELIGFRVRHLAGAVMREAAGDKMIGNHLAPVVELDRLYLSDPTMGLFEPVALEEGEIRHGFRRYSLEQVGDGWWRFRNHPDAMPPSFDFSLDVDEPAFLEGACEWLQTDPGSPFVRHALLQRHFSDRSERLVGRTHTVISGDGAWVREIDSKEEYERVAQTRFQAMVPDLDALWDRINLAPPGGFVSGMDEAA